jgi:D-3-phosphoglycerate dehydrogenase / 2-oxoglutarate reductase
MPDRWVVFVPEPFPEEALGVLDERFEVRLGRDGNAYSEIELAGLIADVDGLAIYSRDQVSATVLEAAKQLRVIAKGGSKPTSNVDIAAAERRGVKVIWTPGANAVSVAEMTLALMLSGVKRLPELAEHARRGAWRSFDLLGRELAGLTLGLVGFGAIGKEVAKRYRAFGGTVLAYDPYFDHAVAERVGVRRVELDTLLRQSDIVSLHCEMNPQTRRLINPGTLAQMKDGALLINTARGGLVDQEALITALNGGRLAGAALDVFSEEPPLTNDPALSHPRVFPTPHVAAFTHESIYRESAWALEDAGRVLLGLKPLHFPHS